MKFIHIADLHLDTPLVSLKNNRNLIKKRRAEHKQVWKEVIELAKSEKVDFLFVSGDVFEHKYVEKSTIDYLISSLELIPEVKVLIAPGNHDPNIKNSPYRTYQWPENVTIFDGTIRKISIGDVDIYGFGFEDFELTENKMANFKVDDPDRINVLVTHGTLNGKSRYNDLNSGDLNQFDYVALGHIHLPKLDNKIVYPGALVACGFDECGEHGLVIGNLEKNDVTYEFRNMEHRHYEIVEVDISNAKVVSDVTESLTLKDNIYRIVLKGDRNIDISELSEAIYALSDQICEVRDETHLPFDLEEIAASKNLKGIFTKKMLEYLAAHPEEEDVVMQAIDITYKAL